MSSLFLIFEDGIRLVLYLMLYDEEQSDEDETDPSDPKGLKVLKSDEPLLMPWPFKFDFEIESSLSLCSLFETASSISPKWMLLLLSTILFEGMRFRDSSNFLKLMCV